MDGIGQGVQSPCVVIVKPCDGGETRVVPLQGDRVLGGQWVLSAGVRRSRSHGYSSARLWGLTWHCGLQDAAHAGHRDRTS